MGKTLILVAAIGALATAHGCSSSGSSGGTTTVSRSDLDYPLMSTDVATGADVYAEYCEGCHPGGEEGDGPKIAGKMDSPLDVRWKVRTGGEDMPAFGHDKISRDNLEALLAYAETLGIVKR